MQIKSSSGLTRRGFLRIAALSAATTALAGIGSFAYAHDIEPGWIEIVRLRLTLPRLAPAFDGYRLAHLSDLHADVGATASRLQDVAALVNAEQPDLVVITGDFVTRAPAEASFPALLPALRALNARDGAAAVLGNHDHWAGAAAVRRMLEQAGVHELRNAAMTLQRGAARLHIAGVDSYWERQDRLEAVLAALPADGAAVLLAHEPDYADISAASGRFDLQLSGHTHGGQVVLPVVGPPVLPPLGKKYPAGRYQVGSMIQYTNRGLGVIQPRVRFNCRPEITIISLAAASTAAAAPTASSPG